MVNFEFKQFGSDLGTRMLGQQAREKLEPMIMQSQDKVVLDFSGVNVVSNSFADECIAKLLITIPLAELRSKTTFSGLNEVARNCVLTALRRRQTVIDSLQ